MWLLMVWARQQLLIRRISTIWRLLLLLSLSRTSTSLQMTSSMTRSWLLPLSWLSCRRISPTRRLSCSLLMQALLMPTYLLTSILRLELWRLLLHSKATMHGLVIRRLVTRRFLTLSQRSRHRLPMSRLLSRARITSRSTRISIRISLMPSRKL